MSPACDVVVVVGGGAVGCALLHALTSRGFSCLLLEKQRDLAGGAASGGNSGITHSGFDADPLTVEGRCLRAAWPLVGRVCEEAGVTHRRCGAVMVARNAEELQRLPALLAQFQSRVLEGGIRLLSREELHELEPHLTREVLGGILIPGEGVIDSNLASVTLAHTALRNGAMIKCSQHVTSVTWSEQGVWRVRTASGEEYSCAAVVNAAGLHGDVVEALRGAPSRFTIKPRKGQFAVYGKEAGPLLKHIILPIPTERTKGIIVYPSPYGNLVVGPTAEDVEEREQPTVDDHVIADLVAYAQYLVPELSKHEIIGTYAGLRPATSESKDFHIYVDPEKPWITVGGIRSTGQTAGMGIALHVLEKIQNELPSLKPSRSPPTAGTFALPSFTDKPSYVLDGAEYNVVHPLMKMGLQKKSKL